MTTEVVSSPTLSMLCTWPTFDARDAHRRARLDARSVGDHDLDPERLRERHVVAEHEEGDDRDDRDQDRAGRERRDDRACGCASFALPSRLVAREGALVARACCRPRSRRSQYGSLPRLALLLLARRRGVRVGVRVEVVRGRGAVRGRRRGPALGVRPGGRRHDDEALPGAVRGHPRRGGSRCCGTRACRSCRRSARGSRWRSVGRSETTVSFRRSMPRGTSGSLGEALDGAEDVGELGVERGHPAQRDDAELEGVREHRERSRAARARPAAARARTPPCCAGTGAAAGTRGSRGPSSAATARSSPG